MLWCATNKMSKLLTAIYIVRGEETILSLMELKTPHKVIGSKQVKKAIMQGGAKKVYLANDAEPHITGPLWALCREHHVAVESDLDMQTLGNACGIDVGSAAVAILID